MCTPHEERQREKSERSSLCDQRKLIVWIFSAFQFFFHLFVLFIFGWYVWESAIVMMRRIWSASCIWCSNWMSNYRYKCVDEGNFINNFYLSLYLARLASPRIFAILLGRYFQYVSSICYQFEKLTDEFLNRRKNTLLLSRIKVFFVLCWFLCFSHLFHFIRSMFTNTPSYYYIIVLLLVCNYILVYRWPMRMIW